MTTEFQTFLKQWQREFESTIAVMEALPRDQYDFRPQPNWRSIGELAWHLAEIDGYLTIGVASGEFTFATKPAHIERPRAVEALAPAFRVVHEDAVARLNHLTDADLDRLLPYADGTNWSIRDLLWRKVLLHGAHHRGQLSLLCRMAGGVPPGLFGPNREEMVAKKAAAAR